MKYLIVPVLFLAMVTQAQPSDSLLAVRTMTQAESLVKKNQPDSAAQFFSKALVLFQKSNRTDKVVECQNRLSTIYWKGGRFGEAKALAREALALTDRTIGHFSKEAADCYNNLGAASYSGGEYTQAIGYYKNALAIQKQVFGEPHAEVANSYNSLGLLYWETRNLSLALDCHEKSLILRKQLFGDNHPMTGYSYNNMGIIFRKQRKFDLAIEHYNKALEIAKRTSGENHIDYASKLNNLGNVFIDMGELDKALDYIQRACTIADGVLGKESLGVTIGYENLAKIYERKNDTVKALSFLDKIVTIRKKGLGDKHIQVARAYVTLGDWYCRHKQYAPALESFQRALVASVSSFNELDHKINPKANQCTNYIEVLSILEKKASTLAAQSARQQTDGLTLALKTYDLGDSIMNHVRGSLLRQQDKLVLSQTSTLLYRGAVETCMQLARRSESALYHAKAFYFSERSKARILTEAIGLSYARQSPSLSPQMLTLEKELQEKSSKFQTMISRKQTEGKPSVDYAPLSDSLITTNQKMDSLMTRMKENYPNYFQLVHGMPIMEISEMQEKLNGSISVIEFFEGDSVYYAFGIDHRDFKVWSIPKDKALQEATETLTSGLAIDGASLLSAKSYTSFTQAAHTSYIKLFAAYWPEIPEAIRQVVIIPDGKLSFLSFDVLLPQPAKSADNYSTLTYLLKRVSISYGYSASLLFGENRSTDRLATGSLLSYAPSYKNSTGAFASELGKFRDALTELRWNQEEATALQKYFPGKSFTGNEATEATFKRESPNFDIIHLAMHAFTDDDDPMTSRLVFANDSTSEEDGYLHAFELYNMQLKARLAVLSACNTGAGTWTQGEGIMSLSRAFAYAGVPSAIMSRWRVDDEATLQLMQLFYEFMEQGMPVGEAMQQAKLRFLQTSSPAQAHPFYWASFSSWGDHQLVINSPMPWWRTGISIGVGLVALLAFGYYRTRYRQVQKK